MQLLSGVLPRAPRGPERPREEDAEYGGDSPDVRPWHVRLRPRRFGRAVVAKSKPVPAPVPPKAPAPIAASPEPFVPMMTLDGHPLPSLRRLPPIRRGPSADLLSKSSG